MKDKLLEFIENQDRNGMITFLQALTIEERRSLVPEIEQYDQLYDDDKEKKRAPGAWDKRAVNNIAAFVCFPPAEAKKIWRWRMPKPEELDKILPWYCPKDFGDYQFLRSYEYLIKWEQAGYLSLTEEEILFTLPASILKPIPGNRGRHYTLEAIEKYPITLDEHIWYLFYAPSNVDWADKWLADNKDKKETKGNWCDTFIKYTSEGRIDRMRVLRESLQTANRNFNKTQTGWFVDLFMALEPTQEELLNLQDELFSALTSVWSKPVSNTMKLLKKLAADQNFRINGFLPSLPILLSSEVKSVVTTTLAVLEVLLKKHKGHQTEISINLCTAFLTKDEAVQKKAGELLVKYAQPTPELKDLLATYVEHLLMNTRTLLKNYLPDTEQAVALTPEEPIIELRKLISDENKIPELKSVEDFAFFLGQAIDLSEPFHFDHLLNNLIVWGNEIKEEELVLLEPIFQKVYKTLGKWESPKLDGMAHIALTNYGDYLIQKFSGKLTKLAKMKEKYAAIELKRAQNSKNYKKRAVNIEERDVSIYLKGFHQIAIEAVDRIKKQHKLPLLSTPTHLPVWIDASVLVERLVMYQQQHIAPVDMDMQLAIQRCALEETGEALQKARKQLSGELKELMIFLLDTSAIPQGAFAHLAWWATVALTRLSSQISTKLQESEYKRIPQECFTGNYQWVVFMEDYMTYEYNPEIRGYDSYPAQRAKVGMNTPKCEYNEDEHPLFYEYLLQDSIQSEPVDFLFGAIPNNPDMLLSQLTTYFANCDMWGVGEQHIAFQVARVLQESNTPFREMHYFSFACLLLGKAKTCQDYAFSIWLEKVSADTLDSCKLGKVLGKLESLELFPLKRLTDLMTASMLRVSDKHNKALFSMIESLLAELKPQPIKNLKKLLEIYKELLALTKEKPGAETIKQLNIWTFESNLKKVIKQILK
ncbi:DUF6493 family protein [Bacteroides sp. 224]|uniref:DUF6493 family protein n=1 Tax=Bacteroides sp. 224 TaxID=2302936 RepID=UPI0013D55BE5|nr:DUF6493 family protein [Bacteroides sp. 224]NDV66124.1 hypothetical protein [Bacteroides sp. 224]